MSRWRATVNWIRNAKRTYLVLVVAGLFLGFALALRLDRVLSESEPRQFSVVADAPVKAFEGNAFWSFRGMDSIAIYDPRVSIESCANRRFWTDVESKWGGSVEGEDSHHQSLEVDYALRVEGGYMISYLIGDAGTGVSNSKPLMFQSFLDTDAETHELRAALNSGGPGLSLLPGGVSHLPITDLPPLTYSDYRQTVTLQRNEGPVECKVAELVKPNHQPQGDAFTIRSRPDALLTQAFVNSGRHPGQYFALSLSNGNAWIGDSQVTVNSAVDIVIEGEFLAQIEGERIYLQGSASSFRINNEEQLSRVLSSYISRSLIEGAVLVLVSLIMGYFFGAWVESRR